jgi:hypothetical protein
MDENYHLEKISASHIGSFISRHKFLHFTQNFIIIASFPFKNTLNSLNCYFPMILTNSLIS